MGHTPGGKNTIQFNGELLRFNEQCRKQHLEPLFLVCQRPYAVDGNDYALIGAFGVTAENVKEILTNILRQIENGEKPTTAGN